MYKVDGNIYIYIWLNIYIYILLYVYILMCIYNIKRNLNRWINKNYVILSIKIEKKKKFSSNFIFK